MKKKTEEDKIIIVSSRRRLFNDDIEHTCQLCKITCYTSARNHYPKKAGFVCMECVQENDLQNEGKISVTKETVEDVERITGKKMTKKELIEIAEKEMLNRRKQYVAS